MNTQDVANRLITMCREGKNLEAIDELYADNITSKEMPGMPNDTVSGKEAVRQKSEQWMESIEEFHGGEVSDPVVAGNHFTCRMTFDATFKEGGRQQMEEIGIFEVKEGKIVGEQFFYELPPQ